MSSVIIQRNGTDWDEFHGQNEAVRIHIPDVKDRVPVQRDDQWIEFLAQLRDWSADPASIPLEEGDDLVSAEVAKKAFEHAFALYHAGKVAPTMVVPSSDGAIVLERHIKQDDGKLVNFEHWSLRYTTDGIKFEMAKGSIPSRQAQGE